MHCISIRGHATTVLYMSITTHIITKRTQHTFHYMTDKSTQSSHQSIYIRQQDQTKYNMCSCTFIWSLMSYCLTIAHCMQSNWSISISKSTLQFTCLGNLTLHLCMLPCIHDRIIIIIIIHFVYFTCSTCLFQKRNWKRRRKKTKVGLNREDVPCRTK